MSKMHYIMLNLHIHITIDLILVIQQFNTDIRRSAHSCTDRLTLRMIACLFHSSVRIGSLHFHRPLCCQKFCTQHCSACCSPECIVR